MQPTYHPLTKDITTAMNRGFDSIMSRLRELGIGTYSVRNKIFTTADGDKFETDSDGELAVGDAVIAAETGKPLEDGEYIVAGVDKKMVVKGGKISALEDAEPTEEGEEAPTEEQLLNVLNDVLNAYRDIKDRLKFGTASYMDRQIEERVDRRLRKMEAEARQVFAQVRNRFNLPDQKAEMQRSRNKQFPENRVLAAKERRLEREKQTNSK